MCFWISASGARRLAGDPGVGACAGDDARVVRPAATTESRTVAIAMDARRWWGRGREDVCMCLPFASRGVSAVRAGGTRGPLGQRERIERVRTRHDDVL